jgi:integrase
MEDLKIAIATAISRRPWNKGKLTGAKPPLRPKHVWSIRTKLQIEGRVRDLAMFNLAIDRKLRGCDVVAIKVEDVAAGGYTADRATVRQKKTGHPVRFELTEQTRQAVNDYLMAANKKPGEFLFVGHRGPEHRMTTRQYARLVSEWIGSIGLDKAFWNALAATHIGYVDLPAHRRYLILPGQSRPSLSGYDVGVWSAFHGSDFATYMQPSVDVMPARSVRH